MLRFLQKLLKLVNTPAPLWLVAFVLQIALASAASFIYYGSISVPSSGSATFNGTATFNTASVQHNSPFEYTGSSSGAGGSIAQQYLDSTGSMVFNVPTAGLFKFLVAGAQIGDLDASGKLNVSNLNLSGLSASAGILCLDASKNVTTSGCQAGGTSYSATSPLSLTNNTFACATCLTTAGGQTITAADTFQGNDQFTSPTYFLGASGMSCAGVDPALAGLCIGSGAGTTKTIALEIGDRLNAGFAGSTAADSLKVCYNVNTGAVGDDEICNHATSGLTFNVGEGASTIALGGSGSVPVTANSTIQAEVAGSPGYLPPVYTSKGAQTANTVHIVRDNGSSTLLSPCSAVGTLCLNYTILFSASAKFASGASYDCFESSANQPLEAVFYPYSGSEVYMYLYNESGSAYSGAVSFSYTCIGS